MAFIFELLLFFLVIYGLVTQIVVPALRNKPLFPLFRSDRPVANSKLAKLVAEAQEATDKLSEVKSELVSATQTARNEAAELERAATNLGKNL